jgi:DNA-directed RNA polymerase I and III subunit RPAC1
MSEDVSFIVKEEYCEQNLSVAGATEIREAVPNSSIQIISYEKITEKGEDRLVFDLLNAPASHANALRRTLLSSVPSVAIEVVGVLNNTGVMPDEVLCHRLGLVPINFDPHLVEFPEIDNPIQDDSNDSSRVLLFGLHVKGGEGPEPDLSNVDASMENELPPIYIPGSLESPGVVTSAYLVWMPFEGQVEQFKDAKNLPAPLYDDIPLTKIIPGQEIHLYCRAIKGIGSDHAKFQPVCTAFYRLIPDVKVDTEGKDAKKKLQRLVDTCHVGVFSFDSKGEFNIDERKCTTCRECIRNPTLAKRVRLGKKANHYEFTVESVGVQSAPELVREALEIISNRCDQLKEAVDDAIQ